jgi:hypothetical protein
MLQLRSLKDSVLQSTRGAALVLACIPLLVRPWERNVGPCNRGPCRWSNTAACVPHCPPCEQVHCSVTGRDLVAEVEVVRAYLESDKYKRLQRTATADFEVYKVCTCVPAGVCLPTLRARPRLCWYPFAWFIELPWRRERLRVECKGGQRVP